MIRNLSLLLYPAKSPSPFMDKMTFGSFNKPFKPNRTKFDWLSHDNEQVDKYVADPYCGAVLILGRSQTAGVSILSVLLYKHI